MLPSKSLAFSKTIEAYPFVVEQSAPVIDLVWNISVDNPLCIAENALKYSSGQIGLVSFWRLNLIRGLRLRPSVAVQSLWAYNKDFHFV